MKNNNKNVLLIASAIIATSCASSPDMYRPEPYKEDISFYQPYDVVDRAPSNILGDCFSNMKNFFGFKKPRSEDEIADLAANHATNRAITEAMVKNQLRYSNGFDGQKGMHIQYGFESEYLHEESEVILKNYMPLPPFFRKSKAEWMSYSHEERLKIFNDLIEADRDTPKGSKFFEYRAKGKLIKIADDKELSDALPDSFVYDSGHFELVLDPHDSAESLIKKIKVINSKVGVGSMQMTISNPLDKKLLKSNVVARTSLKKELIGYYNFMNDFDTLSKLGTGYERYLKDESIQAAKSFNHPWLGPMNEIKHFRLQNLVDGMVDGKSYNEEELKQMSYTVVSHKFIGGLSFRPDVAYKKNRLASEVRDCHQNVKCIEDRIIRETYFLMKGRDDFKKFTNLKQFETVSNFKGISSDAAKNMLVNIFPPYGTYKQVELQLFRNFAYPYRDWSGHVEMLGVPGLKEKIALAQINYTEALNRISNEFNSRAISKAEAQTKVMGALTEFSVKSGLVDAMKSKYKELVNPEEIKHFEMLRFSIYYFNFPLTGKGSALVG